MRLLTHDDTSQISKPLDLAIIMMGSPFSRTERAIELLRENKIKQLVFAESEFSRLAIEGYAPSDGQLTKDLLIKAGVSPYQILFYQDTRNSSSISELRFLSEQLQQKRILPSRIGIITSWYHSSRAIWTASQIFPESIQLISLPTQPPDAWWLKESDFLAVVIEYIKWLYYLIQY